MPIKAETLGKLLLISGVRGDWYDTNCLAHADLRPSFSFKDGRDGLVLLCRAGCTPTAIVESLRKRFPNDQFTLATRQPRTKRRITKTYLYRDENGHLRYEVVRYEPKDFRHRRPDGQGGYIWNMTGVRRVLYRLPGLKDCKLVWIVEGEEDADTLWALRCPATTNAGGAGKWSDDYPQQLLAQGVESVIIIPDNDEPGEHHARVVARSCFRAGLTVAILRPPGLPQKGDTSNWFQQGHTTQELFALIDEAEIVTEDTPVDERDIADAHDPSIHTAKALADRLVGLAEAARLELFHTPLEEAFACIPVEGHNEVWPVDGGGFRAWLTRHAWQQLRRAVSADVLNTVVEVLRAKALYEGAEESVHVRTARVDDVLYYDLVDAEWRVVKVTAAGWEILRSAPVRFRRYVAMAAQVDPQPGGAVDKLWEFVNIPDTDERRLLEAWAVTALIPDMPRPILTLHGAQGAGKTTAARMLGALIDPSHAPFVRARDEAGFIQALAHHSLSILDNLSSLPEWLSDLLSRAVTGEGFVKRQHYTNDEDFIYAFRRAIILTGINLVVTKPDLLDRSLLIRAERVPDEQRVEDRVLSERFTAARPKLFGAVLDQLVKAMAEYHRVRLEKLPRMADFARWGAAVAQGQGCPITRFERAYELNIARQHEQAIAESPTATLLLTFMEGRRDWTGEAAELLRYLQTLTLSEHIGSRDLPRSPQALGRLLHELRPNLAAFGVEITFSRHHHPRRITIIRRGAN